MSEIKGWSCYETLGIGMPNPRTTIKMPITPEMLESLRPKAEALGLTPGEYLEREIDRWNAEETEEKS